MLKWRLGGYRWLEAPWPWHRAVGSRSAGDKVALMSAQPNTARAREPAATDVAQKV